MWKKIFALAFLTALFYSAALSRGAPSFAEGSEPVGRSEPSERSAQGAQGDLNDLVIYHTNDVHGYAFEERDEAGQLVRIGYDRVKALVDADPSPRKLLLDAGDALGGQAFATARKGELVGEVLSLTGYDAIATGNHEFDYGFRRFMEVVNKYRLNFLAANVILPNGEPLLAPYLVRSWGDMKVGIFGLSTPLTLTSVDPRFIEGLKFTDPIEEALATVDRLKAEGAELIVAVTHLGSEPYCEPMSQTVAERVPGIDLVLDGHSHSVAVIPIERADGSRVIVASAGAYLENIGRVAINRKGDGGFSIDAEIIPASSPEIAATAPDPAARAAMGAIRAELEAELSQIALQVPFDLVGLTRLTRSSSTNFGRLVSAALADATGADVALINGGSIRDNVLKGDVTRGQLLSALPYGNYIYLINVTGEDLLAALTHGLALPGAGAFPQFWGLEVVTEKREVTSSNGAKSVALVPLAVTVGGKPLDPQAEYSLATIDFMYSGGDGYAMFGKYPFREFGGVREAFSEYMTEKDDATLRAVSEAIVLK
ncbi:MAG: bifunctional metallophosphatase/5'-nucleotidase [Deltaproteobacteria bacterium]|jgi:2',3'-cyclic-nucleotide 2'-phosphodiesterase (5'-nucleotidase family)|nr:bifunctional metallophosphatase/5'-nucleotidase [Deltaproteobacteria bacterium]